MSVVASLVVLVGSHVAAEPIYVPTGIVYCEGFDAVFDPASVHTDIEASEGGAFWLPLVPDGVVARAFYAASGPSLRTGSGEELVPVVVHETSSVVVVAVPEGATAGASFLLHPADSDDPADTLVLRVVARDLVVGDVTIARATPIADPSCSAECTEDGQVVPSAPAVSFASADAASAVIDAWVLFDGQAHSAFTPRLIDSLLVTLPAGGEQTLQVGAQYLDAGTPYTIVVEARSPVDAALLKTETFVVDAHEEVPFVGLDENYIACSDYNDYDGGDYRGACGCSGAGDPASTVGAALFALALRRRRSLTRGA